MSVPYICGRTGRPMRTGDTAGRLPERAATPSHSRPELVRSTVSIPAARSAGIARTARLRCVDPTERASAPHNGTAPPPFSRHYSVQELAQIWRLDPNSIRRVFQDVPGVLKLGKSNPRGKRGYVTLRIPASVAERVYRERTR